MLKTPKKTVYLSLIGSSFCAVGCGQPIVFPVLASSSHSQETSPESTPPESTPPGSKPVITLQTPCELGGDCQSVTEDAVVAESVSGSGAVDDPLVASLCDGKNGQYTFTPLVLTATSDVSSFNCTNTTASPPSPADLFVTAESNSVSIHADNQNFASDPTEVETFTCTAVNSAGSTNYYLNLNIELCTCCFSGETQVLMADGSSKKIEEVVIGDKVKGNLDQINEVLALEKPLLGSRRLYSINGVAHFFTAEHPFMTLEGWKSIDPEATLKEWPPASCRKA